MADKQTELDIPEYNLYDLLIDNPPASFDLTDEDRAWLDVKPVGNEFGATTDDE